MHGRGRDRGRGGLTRRQLLRGGSGRRRSRLGGEAFAVTMWEFSWLVRREGAEAEYADPDRVLADLAARGYDAVRIDAFPHLIAADADGSRQDRFTILPQNPMFYWGNHAPVEVEPRAALVDFLRRCRAHGIRVGLSSWFNDDATHRRERVVTPADYARIWTETLAYLDREGVLDERVLWVDLCNEFPLDRWAAPAYERIFDTPRSDGGIPLPVVLPWSDGTLARVQAYLDEGIGPVKEAFPEHRYCFSFQGQGIDNVTRLDASIFDVGEVHVWASDSLAFLVESLQALVLLEVPGTLPLHAAVAPGVWGSDRARWLDVIAQRVARWTGWADRWDLELITTEAWGPINYDDLPPLADAAEWDWVKDAATEGVRLAVEAGWQGVCTTNFCQPHFEGMWADVDWHLQRTGEILTGARNQA